MSTLIVRQLGFREYEDTAAAMRAFTDARDAGSADEIWLLEHPPVFTLGRAATLTHVLDPGDIPVVRSERGGQVTYHGPGQLVAYVLIDLQRRNLGIKRLVQVLEDTLIELLSGYAIAGARRPGAPGVYVDGKKIAALGLRVRRGCSYHGISLNVAMDLEPFRRINPCGYPGLEVTQLAELADIDRQTLTAVGGSFARILARRIGYNDVQLDTPSAPSPGLKARASNLAQGIAS